MGDRILRILAINPGSTSTKIGLYENERCILEKSIRYNRSDLEGFAGILEQKAMRKTFVMDSLEEAGISLNSLNAVVGRCGMVKPVESGTYLINDKLLHDLSHGEALQHASSLGGIIAYELGRSLSIPAYVVDPVTVDEMIPVARVTGIKDIARRSIFHALNSRFVAKRFCRERQRKYEECHLIVAHLGGGITVSAHLRGKTIDVNDGSAGEGPFSPERTGGLPVSAIINLCFSGLYTKEQLLALVMSNGGMQMLLGTNDLREAERRIDDGDDEALLVVEAMAYQVAKQIGAMAAALEGKADGIVLTGGLAYSQRFTQLIRQRVEKMGPVTVYPGEDELQAMVEGALAVFTKQEQVKHYGT
ncbi:MAG TPA: butyrate kinase [Desulfitobacterium dehalogenans]|uniref:Probable butyrate kinase n=1 Tax=Desulfitobacterium dehalogenans TaxID=36854 RepID=A0A7C7DD66_9FIRM|nr:butyrate kinase [Desulfitobacterium dehalogenans]